MDVSGRGLTVQPSRAVTFAGSGEEAGALLRDIGLSLVNQRGQVRSGYLRLTTRADGQETGGSARLQTGLRRFFNGGSNQLAKGAVTTLVAQYAAAKGIKGVHEALNRYLQGQSDGRIGSQSFIKLLQALGVDDEHGTIAALQPVGGRLVTDDILKPNPDAVVPEAKPKVIVFSREGLLEGLGMGTGSGDHVTAEFGGDPLDVPRQSLAKDPIPSDPQQAQSLKEQEPVQEPVQLQPSSAGRPILRSRQGMGEILDSLGLTTGRKLGGGGFGVVRALVDSDDKEVLAFKALEQKGEQTIRFDAAGKLVRTGELMAAYLEKGDDPDYAQSIGALANEYLIVAEDSLSEGAAKRETLLIPREAVKSYLRAHGERIARGETVPKLQFRGAIMPLVDYPDLATTVKKGGALKDFAATGLMLKGLVTLQGLSQRGLIHRDIKPDNLFFNPQTFDFQLADFGLMKKRSKDEESGRIPLQPRSVGGTLGYMHPRVYTGAYGPEVDLHSFAITVLRARYPEAMGLILDRALKPLNKSQSKREIDANTLIDLIGQIEDEIEEGEISLPSGVEDRVLQQLVEIQDGAITSQPTLAAFALRCLDQASRPYQDWASRDLAVDRYDELFGHPYIRSLGLE